MKVVIYTAIFGTRDRLWPPFPPAMRGARHVCFTDHPRREQGQWTHLSGEKWPTITRGSEETSAVRPLWEQQVVPMPYSPRKTARYYKALAHEHFPDADVTIWLDGNVRLLIMTKSVLKHYLADANLATFKHPDRGCLYDEATFCALKGKDSKKTLSRQTAAYRCEKMPAGWGLAETRCIVRRNTATVRRLNELWWQQIDRHSVRDQVSFPYACWKLGVRWRVIPGRVGPSSLKGLNRAFWFAKHTGGK
jgi:hypothetical protein